MPSTLITKYGSGAPLASDLVRGELAVDTENGRLYTENSLGAVVEIGLNPGGNLDVTGTVTADGLTVQKSGDIAQFTNGTRSAYLSADSGGFSLFTGAGQTGNGFYANEAGTYAAIYTNSSEKVRIDSSGNVGLKNSSPSSYSGDGADLVIGTTSGDNGLSIISGTSGTGNIYFGDVEETGTGSRRGQIVYDHVSDHMRFATAATERMRIDSSGNVGIGTESPDTMLHLSDTAGGAVIRLERNDTTIASTDVYGEIQFEGQDASAGSAAGIRGKILGVAEGATGEMALAFQTASGYGSSTERMRIDSTGNVGIGGNGVGNALGLYINRGATTNFVEASDNTKTFIGGTDSGNAYVKTGSLSAHPVGIVQGNVPAIYIDTSKNVGIGTESPAAKLHLNSASTTAILFDSDTSTQQYEMGVGYGGVGTSAFYLYDNTATATRLVVDASGNVGIGTASPAEKLHVAGAIATTAGISGHGANRATFSQEGANGAFIQSYGADTSTMGAFTFRQASSDFSVNATPLTISATGNVGIGTDNPATKLEVSGGYISQTNAGVSTYLGEDSSGGSLVGTTTNNYFRFITNNTERMRIDSTGAVSVGYTGDISNVSSGLNFTSGIYGMINSNNYLGSGTFGANCILSDAPTDSWKYIATNWASRVYHRDGVIKFDRAASGTGGTALTWSESMRIDSSGNVGIGTSSPLNQLVISEGTGQHGIEFAPGTTSYIQAYDRAISDYGDLKIDAQIIQFGTDNGTERMRIDASGNLLVGAPPSQINSTKTSISASSTTNGLGIQNANDSNYLITALNSSSVEVFRVAGTGDVLNTNNSYGSFSDERLKSNIVDASSQIDDIMAVQVRSYTLDSTGDTHIGVVAQELESAGMSGLVQEDKEGMKSVKYSVLYMKALKALQEAVNRIETLEAKVAQLEGAN